MTQPILWAAGATGFTFAMTALGASLVFFFRNTIRPQIQRIFLGFAAGVMIAASVFSLLLPAMEQAEASGVPGWLPTPAVSLSASFSCWQWTPPFPICIRDPPKPKDAPLHGSARH